MRVFNILNLDNCTKGFDLMRDAEVGGLKCRVALGLMYLTGIYKLNSESDLKLFVYRSVLLFVHTDLPAYFFDDGRLFRMDDYSNYWKETDFRDFFGARSQIKLKNLKQTEWEKEILNQYTDPNKKRVFDWMEYHPKMVVGNSIKIDFTSAERKLARLISRNILKLNQFGGK